MPRLLLTLSPHSWCTWSVSQMLPLFCWAAGLHLHPKVSSADVIPGGREALRKGVNAVLRIECGSCWLIRSVRGKMSVRMKRLLSDTERKHECNSWFCNWPDCFENDFSLILLRLLFCFEYWIFTITAQNMSRGYRRINRVTKHQFYKPHMHGFT